VLSWEILRFNDKTESIHALEHYDKRKTEAPSANNSGNRTILFTPKYYDVLFKKLDPALMEQISQTRRDNFEPTNCTPDRLKVREICARAKLFSMMLFC
jgi:hypothetical protein